MKNRISALAIALLAAATATTSCLKIWDIAPITVKVYVSNAEGADLLDPQTVGAFDPAAISATWQGETYAVSDGEIPLEYGTVSEEGNATAVTRAYVPMFYGLSIFTDNNGRRYLYFGELSGEENFNNEVLTIDWGNGTVDHITIYNNFRWTITGNPKITRRFFFNDTKSDKATFRIVR